MKRWMLFFWWSIFPSLQIQLWRRASMDWLPAFRLCYLETVAGQMTADERAFVHAHEFLNEREP